MQIAKMFTSQFNMRMLAEIISIQFVMMICALKYFTFPLQEKKIKVLLESIESDWNSLSNAEDRKIADDWAEEGRKYTFYMVVGIYSCIIFLVVIFGLQPVFDIVTGKNETIPKALLFPAEYFVDVNKYYYPITLHMFTIAFIAGTTLLGNDTLYIAGIYHACGMYRIISHRLEHAFDKYKFNKTCLHDMNNETRLEIANAVKYHHTATEYVKMLVSTFQMPFFIAIILVFLNISLTLYCMATALGKLNELLVSLLLVLSQITQSLIVAYPCQQIADNSSAIAFNAYCGQWYMAPTRLQALILPILQRGAKPTMIVFARMMIVSLEAFAAGIQLSLSYFTVLISFS